MTKQKLDELLEAGNITQEEYDDLVKNVTDPEPVEDPVEPPVTKPSPAKPSEDDDDVAKKVFQAKLDRAMAEERKKNADLKRKLERLEKKILTDEEQKQNALDEQRQELEEQRRELALEKNKMYAVKAMQKAEISNSEEAMLLMEKIVVSCEDETEIDDMIALLKAWKDKDVATEVDKRFKAAGSTPKKSSTLNGGVNPYTREQFSLTEQMSLEINNPELAAQLKAAAGVK